MVSKVATIVNRTGLHARPASDFVKCAQSFASNVTIGREGGRTVSAKSIFMVLAQAYPCGAEVTLSAIGADEQQAVDTLSSLLASHFDE